MFLYVVSLMFGLAAGLFHPEYHDKLEFKQEIRISVDDFDDDLEMIKEPIEIKSNLKDFHDEVQKFKKPKGLKGWTVVKAVESIPQDFMYNDSPFGITGNMKRLSLLQREKKRKDSAYGSRRSSHNDVAKRKTQETEENSTNENETEIETGPALKKEYEEKIKNDLKNGVAFNYSDEGKPEENVKEVVKKIIDVKPPKNCTNYRGIGIKGVECIFVNLKNQEMDKKKVFKTIGIVLLVWLALYLAIAIPLWCIKGWCCCCFRFEFCRPYKTVKNIQKYIALNPPGVFLNDQGEEERYAASVKEIEIYQELNKAILNF